jgi:hypothetical protein
MINTWVCEAVVEAVDDVLLRDVGNGGPHIEETSGVGSEEFITLLLALGEVVPGSCSGYRPLEVVDENLLEAFPGVDGVIGEAFQPGQRCRLQSHRKVDDFGSVGAASHLNGSGVTAEPLLLGLLTIILGNTNWLETLRLLIAVESHSERRKTIAAVSIISLGYLAFPPPRVED